MQAWAISLLVHGSSSQMKTTSSVISSAQLWWNSPTWAQM